MMGVDPIASWPTAPASIRSEISAQPWPDVEGVVASRRAIISGGE
jgi:hypothetical protein